MNTTTMDEAEEDLFSKSPILGLASLFVWTLFMDENQIAYAEVLVGDHMEIMPIEGGKFKRFLKAQYYSVFKDLCSSKELNTAIDIIAAYAQFDGDGTIKLHNRITWCNDSIHYDSADHTCWAVRVGREGWYIDRQPPILFRRYLNQVPQVMPSTRGNIRRFVDFLNVQDKNEILLIVVWIVTAFIPGFPHVILNIFGPHGSAKSTFCKMLKMLIDPGIKLTDSLPRSQTALIKRLYNSWLTIFDNLGTLTSLASDTLCRCVTGDGHAERKLRTNNEEVIYEFQHLIILNSINQVATQPDIRDRSLTLKLDRIGSQNRKPEKQLLQEFKEALPEILGGIFDILSKAMSLYSKAEEALTGSLPRMADFAIWGFAISEALGVPGSEFMKAYRDNIEYQNFVVIFDNPVAHTLIKFMDKRSSWYGTPHVLLDALNAIAADFDIKDKDWPKEGRALTRKLNLLQANLLESGIAIETGIHTSIGNTINIENLHFNNARDDGSSRSNQEKEVKISTSQLRLLHMIS